MQVAVLSQQVSALTAASAGFPVQLQFFVCMTSLQLCCGMQGKDWSYQDLAKDMLDLHDPGVVKVVHDLRVKQDSQLPDQLKPTLESVHTECINFYTAWFQELHADYSEQDLLATAGRTDDVTRAAASSSPWPTAETLLSALGLQYSS